MKKILLRSKRYFFVPIFIGLALGSCGKDKKTIIDEQWEVQSIRVHTDSASINAVKDYVLSFENKKNYSINLDVNSCSGAVTFERKNSIDFGTAGCTKICCDSAYALSLLHILESVNKYDVNESSLILTGDAGKRISLEKRK